MRWMAFLTMLLLAPVAANACGGMGNGAGAGKGPAMFEAMDTNHDGSVSKEEFAAHHRAMHEKRDQPCTGDNCPIDDPHKHDGKSCPMHDAPTAEKK